MKQFIVLAAVLPIMLVFMAQFTLDIKNNAIIDKASDIVYAAKEIAKQEGGFDIESLSLDLANALGVDKDEIIIEADTAGSVKRIDANGKRGIIHYKVIIPIKDVYAGKGVLGIDDNKNYGYKIESSAPSEYLGE